MREILFVLIVDKLLYDFSGTKFGGHLPIKPKPLEGF
jgi:hypothetical protein